MRHVDEGILNAYLDGELDALGARSEEQGAGSGERWSGAQVEAHVAECEQCAALLREAERVRDAASSILASSTPAGLEVPPFEEIRARAEARGQSQRVVKMGNVRKLAWAATVVLAVAVGWYARGTIIPGATDQLSAPEAAVVASDFAEGAGSGEPGAEDREQAAGRGERGAQSELRQAEEEGLATAAAAERDMLARRVAAEGQPSAEAPATMATEATPERTKAEADPGVRLDEVVDVSRERKGVAAAAEQPQPEAPRAVLQQVAANEPSAPVAGVAVGEVLMLEDSLWVEATESEAREALGGEVPTVPDLPILDYWVSLMQRREVVRVRQQLDDDEVIAVVVSRTVSPIGMVRVQPSVPAVEAVANEPRDADAAATSTVILRVGEYQIVLRGPVSPDSLRVLGVRIGG